MKKRCARVSSLSVVSVAYFTSPAPAVRVFSRRPEPPRGSMYHRFVVLQQVGAIDGGSRRLYTPTH